MEFRLAEEKDMVRVITLINQAKQFLAQQNVDQWQNGYPNAASIQEDLQKQNGYVLCLDGTVVGYACISFDGEPCYADLQGKWLSEQPYAVIHQMVIGNQEKGKGFAGQFFSFAEQLCRTNGIKSVKVDTDRDNLRMQAVLQKLGFVYCGTVCFDNSEKLRPFQVLCKPEKLT